MPLRTINYDNVCFYKIVCRDLSVDGLYVGHTTDFTSRKQEHKRNATEPNKNRYNSPVYKYIRENGGWDNFDMILIERCKCDDKLEACKLERQHIEKLGATLNAHMPGRTKTVYYQDKKEYVLSKAKAYYENNTDKCKEWKNATIECDCGHSFTNANRARHIKTKKHQTYLSTVQD